MRNLVLLAALMSCAKSVPPAEPVVDANAWRSVAPASLPARPFELPPIERGHLQNGVPVVVVQNHETPSVRVRVVFRSGGWTDPKDRVGLASATMSMLTEGAGKYDAVGLSEELRKLATSINGSEDGDSATLSLSTLASNLEPSLDLFRTVLLEPTFPKAEWDIERQERTASLERALKTPTFVADRVLSARLYSGTYDGALATVASYSAMTTAQMKDWYKKNLVPGNAIVLVGGDTTLEAILPPLDRRFGSWKGTTPVLKRPDPSILHSDPTTTIVAVDSPGSTQSVLRVAAFVDADRVAPDFFDLKLGNLIEGGYFISRMNMNLREDKGYTYGLSSWVGYDYLPGLWTVATQVRADVTAPALQEILAETAAPTKDRPFQASELDAARGYLLGLFPLRFESPSEFLSWTAEQWLYSLPDDWISGYRDHVRAVSVDSANAAWAKRIPPTALTAVVVGDMSSLRPSLEALGLPIVWVDHDGRTVPAPAVVTTAVLPATPTVPATEKSP